MTKRNQSLTSDSEGSGLVGDARKSRGSESGTATVERLGSGSATLEGLRARQLGARTATQSTLEGLGRRRSRRSRVRTEGVRRCCHLSAG